MFPYHQVTAKGWERGSGPVNLSQPVLEELSTPLSITTWLLGYSPDISQCFQCCLILIALSTGMAFKCNTPSAPRLPISPCLGTAGSSNAKTEDREDLYRWFFQLLYADSLLVTASLLMFLKSQDWRQFEQCSLVILKSQPLTNFSPQTNFMILTLSTWCKLLPQMLHVEGR